MYINIYLIQCTHKISIYEWYNLFFLFFCEHRFQCLDFRFWRNCVFQNGPRSNRKRVNLRRCGSAQFHALHGCCTSPNTVCLRRNFRFRARPWSTAVVAVTVCGPCGCWTTRRSNGSIMTRSRGKIWRRSRISRRRRRWRSRWSGQTPQPSMTSSTLVHPTESAANRLSPTMTRWSSISSACWGTVCVTSATTVVTYCTVGRRWESNTITQASPPLLKLRVNLAHWAMFKLFDRTNCFLLSNVFFPLFFIQDRDFKVYNHLPGHAHEKLVQTYGNDNNII